MSIFNFLRSNKVTKGMIGYLDLSDWWFEAFTDAERNTIRSVFKPMGGLDLDKRTIQYSDMTTLTFLTGMAGWFKKDEHRPIAYRILEQAEHHLSSAVDPEDIHFFRQSQIEIFYRDRNSPKHLNHAIHACELQIACAPVTAKSFKRRYRGEPLPSHKGYTQLAIVRESQKDYSAAIRLCNEAKKKGWCGDWDKRIARCEKKQIKEA